MTFSPFPVLFFAITCIYLTFSMLTLLPVFIQQCVRCGFVKLTNLNGFQSHASHFVFPSEPWSKLILNRKVHEVVLTSSRQPAGFLFSVVCIFVLLPQDISAHESNILGSFCDMNVSGLIYFSILFSFCPQRDLF